MGLHWNYDKEEVNQLKEKKEASLIKESKGV